MPGDRDAAKVAAWLLRSPLLYRNGHVIALLVLIAVIVLWLTNQLETMSVIAPTSASRVPAWSE